jgi:hypothetical protein
MRCGIPAPVPRSHVGVMLISITLSRVQPHSSFPVGREEGLHAG